MAVTKITGAGLGLPNADGNALGGASNEWSDLYLADSSVIYFGADQDITLTHAADTGLTTNGTFQATTITATTAVVPDASDGAALGTTSLEWSDLYLADGAVLGFGDDQDVTLTHVADTGILLNSTMAIQFNDASQYINAPSNAILDINATDEIELNATLVDVNANLDVSGTGVIAGAITGAAITASGVLKTDDTTAATSTTDGSLQTDGGLSVAADAVIGDDLLLLSDAAVLSFGANSEVTLTHVHNDGLLLNTDMQLQFRDSAINIRSDADGDLDINADDEVEINSTLIDINGNVDISGSLTLGGAVAGADQTLGRVNLKDYGEVTNAIGSTGGGTQDIDLTAGNNVVATVDTSTNTFTFSNPTASDELCGFTLFLTNGGSQTVNWPGTVDWAGGTAPTLTTSGLDILVFITTDGGTIWHGMVGSADSK